MRATRAPVPTEPLVSARWYCTGCGGPAGRFQPGLDPRWGFGYCRAQPRPCVGSAIVTADRTVAGELADGVRARAAARAHVRHLSRRDEIRTCPVCHPGPTHGHHLASHRSEPTCPACCAAELRRG